ncbi:hypothetical protein ACUY3K_08965 [Corynebacterium uberis]|uniref:hypothetical protein n=1 Tax=Corynebacterium TaxID=1716 RepID=UPI001D0B9434|nr:MULTISPECIES: hypothetical protein [Corynebacterium]MCZ9308747.1 hypothetical protein [Corynebacterium sp. c6VSa_13]UDL72722.1 hypothetical protein LH391_06210 [Corynebacterium uberis]UDL76402.1 hypothetical protein LH393_03195 [Corynebacterium uberis]UDL78614.1 hypothetical protein LH394_03180 [Corynebacterium uberis]UDL80893.1 hypothetical protein LH392_03605 [Corynebacterium uberis]
MTELTALLTAARAYADGKTPPRDASRLLGVTSRGDVLLHSVDEHAYALSLCGNPLPTGQEVAVTPLADFGSDVTLVGLAPFADAPERTLWALCIEGVPAVLGEHAPAGEAAPPQSHPQCVALGPLLDDAHVREVHSFSPTCRAEVVASPRDDLLQIRVSLSGQWVLIDAPVALRGSFRPDLGYVQPLGL